MKGNRVLRASNSQEKENISFNNKTEKYKKEAIKVNKINSLINPLTFALTSLVLVIIIILLEKDLFSFNAGVVISTIIAEMAFLAQIFFVTVQLTSATNDIVKGHVSKKRIDEVLIVNTNEHLEEKKEIDNKYLLSFRNVSFFFDKDNMFFKDISFDIPYNTSFGIIGGTGSGKSTLINLIERFYEINEGDIYFNGQSIKSISKEDLRKDIALVNQKSSLFKGSIRSNLLLANKDAKEIDMIKALKVAEAYEFVSSYEDNLDHPVNEGGKNFSGGQRQRLCIARAILKNPKLLILDDSTSALDLLTESKIRNNLKDINKIIISQRVSSIKDCHSILVLHEGKVMGLGSHEDLLNSCDI